MNSAKVAKWRGQEDAAGAEAFFKSVCDAAMKGEAPASAEKAAPVQVQA